MKSQKQANSSNMIPRLLRIQDVARYLGSTSWFVEELIRNKKIKFLIVGKRRVIDVVDLDSWIEEQKQEPLELPRILTDEEARAFFDGMEKDDDGNIIVKIHGED
jgi:excisionase family DNA binding protein